MVGYERGFNLTPENMQMRSRDLIKNGGGPSQKKLFFKFGKK
jgi:hypothetical protein